MSSFPVPNDNCRWSSRDLDEAMTPFMKQEREATKSMEHRLALLQQPCEFFRPFFHGRIPSLEEKVMHVEQMVQRMTFIHIYENNLYRVEIAYGEPFIHLDISRRDGGPCKNWRHFQQIKNELVGPEHEAFELFPAESRLVDAGNQYHLWVHTNAGYRIPVGSMQRWVLDKPISYVRERSIAKGCDEFVEENIMADNAI